MESLPSTSSSLASGWSVHETHRGWQWSAFGADGRDGGIAASKAEAERLAYRSYKRFRQIQVARASGRRAVEKHGDALKRLAEG